MDVSAVLKRAIESGEILKIIYHGGSHPGGVREVAPIKIEDGKVRARCYTSKGVKSFMLNKIQLDGDTATHEQKSLDKRQALIDQVHDIKSAYNVLNAAFESDGWATNCSDYAFTLHHRFKNGKVKKGVVVGFEYSEFTTDIEWGEDYSMIEVTKKRVKPWVVLSKGNSARYFGRVEKAVEAFILAVEEQTLAL